MEQLEHPGHLGSRAPPDGLLLVAGGMVLELARGERAVSLELAQDVPAEPGLLPHELLRPPMPLELAPGLAHQGADQWQVLDRVDERVPLEELPLLPQEP